MRTNITKTPDPNKQRSTFWTQLWPRPGWRLKTLTCVSNVQWNCLDGECTEKKKELWSRTWVTASPLGVSDTERFRVWVWTNTTQTITDHHRQRHRPTQSYRGCSSLLGSVWRGRQRAPCWGSEAPAPSPSLCPAPWPGVGSFWQGSGGWCHHCSLQPLETRTGGRRGDGGTKTGELVTCHRHRQFTN